MTELKSPILEILLRTCKALHFNKILTVIYQHVDSSTWSTLSSVLCRAVATMSARLIGLVILRCRLYHTLRAVEWVTRRFWHKLMLSQNLQFAQRAKDSCEKTQSRCPVCWPKFGPVRMDGGLSEVGNSQYGWCSGRIGLVAYRTQFRSVTTY